MPGAPVFWRHSAEALIQIIPVAKVGRATPRLTSVCWAGRKLFSTSPT